MLKNAYLDAKIGFDPAENEPPKECCVVAPTWAAALAAGPEDFLSEFCQNFIKF